MRKTLKHRRHFLKTSAYTALLGSGAAAVNGKMNLIGSALAAQGDYGELNDYKALVCVFLYGGSDSFNLFIPTDPALYSDYKQSRGSVLGLAQETLLPSARGEVAFNPNMAGLRDIYDAGDIAIVRNVGNLIQPVTRNEYQNNPALIPAELFAHNHQQEQVQKSWSSRPTGLVGAGWGGRMADLLMEANGNTQLPPCFSMFNANFFQPGNRSRPISINPLGGPSLMPYMDATATSSSADRDATMAKLLAATSGHSLEQFAKSSYISARDSSRALSQVVEASPDFGPAQTDNRLFNQLRMVARMMSGREQLGMKRQIFFCGLGGWDTHDNQTPRLQGLSGELNAALADFHRVLGDMGLQNQVTTFTTSDFGRTLTINGDGSDHGWGGHYMVMGGAVNGGKLYGEWNNYAVGSEDDVADKGQVIPTMSLNQYGAALGSWMGLSNSDLLDVFPDLKNFDSGWESQYGMFG